MAQRISNIFQPNRPTVMGATSQGNTASRDRDLPPDLQDNAELPNANNPDTSPEPQHLDDESISGFRALSISGQHDLDLGEGEETECRSPNIASDITHCEACGDDKNSEDVCQAPCNHGYCLQDLFKTAITDESLFPPRCCRQPIPLEAVQMFLTSEISQDFVNKRSSLRPRTKRIALCRPALHSSAAATSPTTWVHAINAAQKLALYAKQQLMREGNVQMIHRCSKLWTQRRRMAGNVVIRARVSWN